MSLDLIFNPELRLRDGTVIRDRQDAIAFARRLSPPHAPGVATHILHLLESATAPEEVEAAAQQFRAWLKRLELIDTGVVSTIASLANSKSGSAGAATRARRTHDPCSPSMPRYRGPNYDRKLSRALVLADGRRLVTLRAAVNVISDLLRSEDEHSDTLNQAIALLLVAANSGAPENVAAATDEAERVLRARRLLGGR